eukprot:355489-Chlamydomonas_euryale.AAC.15
MPCIVITHRRLKVRPWARHPILGIGSCCRVGDLDTSGCTTNGIDVCIVDGPGHAIVKVPVVAAGAKRLGWCGRMVLEHTIRVLERAGARVQ